jgi:hypothetical protein
MDICISFFDFSNVKMNIFFLHRNPRICAQWHCDKHVIKMILEACQLLYSVHYATGSPVWSRAYKKTHPKHPCALWLLESVENYLWTISLAWELAEEYRHRYGSHKMHSCEVHLVWLESHIPPLPLVKMTPPRLAMKPEFQVSKDPVEAYRYYYRVSKDQQRGIVKYTKRKRPDFLL